MKFNALKISEIAMKLSEGNQSNDGVLNWFRSNRAKMLIEGAIVPVGTEEYRGTS